MWSVPGGPTRRGSSFLSISMISVVFIASIKAADDDALRDGDRDDDALCADGDDAKRDQAAVEANANNDDASRAQADVEANAPAAAADDDASRAQAAVEADAAAAGDNAAAASLSFASRAQAAVHFSPVVAFVQPAAAAAFVTSSSVPDSRILFCGCSVAADSNALVVSFVAFVPPAAGVVVAAVDATPSFAAAGADADAAVALGTLLLFPVLFLV